MKIGIRFIKMLVKISDECQSTICNGGHEHNITEICTSEDDEV